MLQRAPETSQRDILNNLSSFGMLNYMGSAVRKSDESYQVILYGGCYCKVYFGPRQKRRRDDGGGLPLFRQGGGNSQPKDQAELKRDQGGFIFKGRFVEAIRES